MTHVVGGKHTVSSSDEEHHLYLNKIIKFKKIP